MASDGCQPLEMNGRLVGYNKDNQNGKLSFPPGVTSYGDLRRGAGRSSTLQAVPVPESDTEFRTRALYGRNNKAHEKTLFNDEGIPVGKTNCTGTSYSRNPPRSSAARRAPASIPPPPPDPIPASFPVAGLANELPSLGWMCTAADAAAAVQAGVKLLDAGDDESAQTALGAALSSVVSSGNGRATVIACCPAGEVAAVNERLAGALDLVFLPASRWSSTTELAEGVPGVALGLSSATPVQAIAELTQLLAEPGSKPVALRVPLNPTSAKVQRMVRTKHTCNKCSHFDKFAIVNS